jgi:drug/metabolite transporter (DMT)-like permease
VATPDAALPSRLAASGALLLATAAWGSTFVVTKSSLDQLAPATFLVWRFWIAALVLVALSTGRARALWSPDRWHAERC